jgi:hypothetical protein
VDRDVDTQKGFDPYIVAGIQGTESITQNLYTPFFLPIQAATPSIAPRTGLNKGIENKSSADIKLVKQRLLSSALNDNTPKLLAGPRGIRDNYDSQKEEEQIKLFFTKRVRESIFKRSLLAFLAFFSMDRDYAQAAKVAATGIAHAQDGSVNPSALSKAKTPDIIMDKHPTTEPKFDKLSGSSDNVSITLPLLPGVQSEASEVGIRHLLAPEAKVTSNTQAVNHVNQKAQYTSSENIQLANRSYKASTDKIDRHQSQEGHTETVQSSPAQVKPAATEKNSNSNTILSDQVLLDGEHIEDTQEPEIEDETYHIKLHAALQEEPDEHNDEEVVTSSTPIVIDCETETNFKEIDIVEEEDTAPSPYPRIETTDELGWWAQPPA